MKFSLICVFLLLTAFLPEAGVTAAAESGGKSKEAKAKTPDTTVADNYFGRFDGCAGPLKRGPAFLRGGNGDTDGPRDMKEILKAADDAGHEFVDRFPNDPRRWQVRLFDAEHALMRAGFGLPSRGETEDILHEIVSANNADDKIKGTASAMLVSRAYSGIEVGKWKPEDWMFLAQSHLKLYPGDNRNGAIQIQLANVIAFVESKKQALELKSSPLDFRFTATNGSAVDFAKLRGKVVLMYFWMSNSPPCVAEISRLKEVFKRHHASGLEIVGISLDTDKTAMETVLKEKSVTWPQFCDGAGFNGETCKRFGIRSLPTMWLLDKKGMVVSCEARVGLAKLVERYLSE